MKKVSLLFGIHMHQPVDNFSKSVDEAIELCYAPFFETMAKYPDFKFALHCSGWLLDQIKQRHPKIFKNMKKLTKSGSIEWVSAGYYEPVLSSIPSRDRVAQITKLNDYITKNLKAEPKGLWLTERVWESSLVPDLHVSGIKYAVVDDYHFLSSGFDAKEMDGYYITEESGKDLALFPISKSLRYALPFFSVKRAIDAILDCKKGENSAAIIFDDAEKFGLWPETHEWVYSGGWLESFVEAVLQNEHIKTQHYSNYLENNRPKAIAYLNNTSYFEMGEWSLKSEQTLELEKLKERVGDSYFDEVGVTFIKGGIWKNFFVKYHESNYLHKRMLSHSITQEKLKKSAIESLYKLQTNDVFWHGVFGGLYLPNLRDNAYTYLLEIERSLAKKKITYKIEDIDKDGYDELKVLTPVLSLVFSSRFGGQLIEFGSLESLFNWQNTLMRRKEAYHEKILNPKESLYTESEGEDEIATIHAQSVIDETLKDELIYDWHPKHSFIDHFSPNRYTLERFKRASFHEVGDFANQPFELDENSLTFTRKGGIYLEKKYPATLKKAYSFDDDTVSLKLTCKSSYEHKLYYGCEFNIHLAHPHLATFNGKNIEDGLEFEALKEFEIIDTFTQKKLILSFNRICEGAAFTLKTISQSESGFERVSQQVSLIFFVEFTKELELDITLGVKNV